jgi:hypothetical protein
LSLLPGPIFWIWREYIKNEHINLKTLDSILGRGEHRNYDQFLRKQPHQMWVDFKEGYIIERSEVNSVMERFKHQPVQFLSGRSSSGKSVIAKQIGYKMRKKGVRVYFERADQLVVNEALNEISKIGGKKALLIIDNVNLSEEICEEFLERIDKPKLKILLVGSKTFTEKLSTLDKDMAERFPKLQRLIDDEKTLTVVKAIDAVKDVFTNFEEKKQLTIKNEHKIDLRTRHGYDLVFLTYALSIYDSERGVPQEILIKFVEQQIKNIEDKFTSANRIILPLSVLYSYEIPADLSFFTECLRVERETITPLIRRGEIIEADNSLSLSHSSKAKLFLEAFRGNPELGKSTKQLIIGAVGNEFSNWETGLFHLYFRSGPKKCATLLSRLSGKDNEIDIATELVENTQTRRAIFQNIIEQRPLSLKKLSEICLIIKSALTKELLEGFGDAGLLELFDQTKLNQLGRFVVRYYYIEEVRCAHGRFSEESHLMPKMKEASLSEIRKYIYDLSTHPTNGVILASNAVEVFKKLDNIPLKIGEEKTVAALQLLIYTTKKIGSDPQFLIQAIKPPFALKSSLKESALNDINMLIFNIDTSESTSGEPQPTSQFIIDQIKQIDANDIAEKLQASTIEDINKLFTNIKRYDLGSMNYLLELIESVDLTVNLKEAPLKQIGWLLWNISSNPVSLMKYLELSNQLELREKASESDLAGINTFLWNLYLTSSETPKIFADCEWKKIITAKLSNEESGIPDKLFTVGVFEFAGCPLEEHVIKNLNLPTENYKLSRQLDRYFSYETNPFSVALVIKGLKSAKKGLRFYDAHTILSKLETAQTGNQKSQQLIQDALESLNDQREQNKNWS